MSLLAICCDCNQQFTPSHPGAIRCPDCVHNIRSINASEMRKGTCARCGKPFYKGRAAQFCDECAVHDHGHNPKRKLGQVDTCLKCGAEYTITGGGQKYCPACSKNRSKEALRLKRAIYGRDVKKEVAERKARTFRVCRMCGNVFTPDKKGNGTYAYCSEACKTIGYKYNYYAHRMKKAGKPAMDRAEYLSSIPVNL